MRRKGINPFTLRLCVYQIVGAVDIVQKYIGEMAVSVRSIPIGSHGIDARQPKSEGEKYYDAVRFPHGSEYIEVNGRKNTIKIPLNGVRGEL